MNKTENVAGQYADDKNLSRRINLHAKHSTNKQGLTPWLFEQYDFREGDRILEFGCGNAAQWEGRIEPLPTDATLVLTDFSAGMVDTVWKKHSRHGNVFALTADIQNPPFPDISFDVVIANYMLYHVPDLDKAFASVARVLKPGGRFYAATNGNGGIHAYIHNALKHFDPATNAFAENFSFSLQNGKAMLEKYFGGMKRIDYEDSLRVTDTEDLVGYIMSSISISAMSDVSERELFDYFERIRLRDGAICIPKETGVFICENPNH